MKFNYITLYSLIDLPNLRRLEINSCDIAKLSSDELSRSLPNLESLEITYLSSTDFRAKFTNFSFENFNKLRRLEIYGQEEEFDFIHTLPPSLSILKIDGLDKKRDFKHSNLSVLDIRVKEASFDAKVLSELTGLRHLRISNERLFSDLYWEFRGEREHEFNEINLEYDFLAKLETLSIEFSSIRHIDFSRLVNLKYLELIGNGKHSESQNKMINLLSNPFYGLKSLEEVRLENLELTNSDLKGAFSNLKRLRVLNLTKNRVNNIDVKTFKGLKNLTRLNMKGNDLNKVKPEVFLSVFPKLEELTLSVAKRSFRKMFTDYFETRFKEVKFH